jgi:bifunctional non-homologous end joining protein LigD
VKLTASSSFSFIEPMKALPVEKLPEGDWLYEIKHDGYRALAFKDGKDVRLVSRNEKEFDYPQLVDALRKLPVERAILDGEIAALDEKGRSSFQLLQLFKKSGDVPLTLLRLRSAFPGWERSPRTATQRQAESVGQCSQGRS